MKKISIRIKDLFTGLGVSGAYDEAIPNEREIFVRTGVDSYSRIRWFVRKHHSAIAVTTQTGRFLIASTQHLIRSNGEFRHLADLSTLDVLTPDGIMHDSIAHKSDAGHIDLYDIGIDDPHVYSCAQGFIHHNTTVAMALADQIGSDWILINASEENGIDVLRSKIKQFASTVSLSGSGVPKTVILDEGDRLTAQTQDAMKAFIEEFSANCRFVFTSNFKNKIIEPIHSRCTCIDVVVPKAERPALAAKFMKRVETILKENSIKYDPKVVADVIIRYTPDWRRILNELQRYSAGGQIDTCILALAKDGNLAELMGFLKDKDFKKMRQWVAQNVDLDPAELYRKIYDNITDYAKPESVPQVVLILADYSYKSCFVVDQELNCASCCVELMANVQWK